MCSLSHYIVARCVAASSDELSEMSCMLYVSWRRHIGIFFQIPLDIPLSCTIRLGGEAL